MVILERQQKISSARDTVRNDIFFFDENSGKIEVKKLLFSCKFNSTEHLKE